MLKRKKPTKVELIRLKQRTKMMRWRKKKQKVAKMSKKR